MAQHENYSAAVDIAMGDVLITAVDGAETTVDVQPSDPSNPDDRKAAELTRVERSGDHVLVKAPKLRTWLSRKGGSVAITVVLPAGSEVNGTVAMGDVRCEGRLGDCRIKTSMGDIRIDEGAALSLKSSAGDIAVEHATGDVDAATGSGAVRLRALDKGAVVKNSNGDTWIGTARGEVRINGANGAIAVESARGAVDARSALGDVSVGIPEGTAAWLDVKAGAGRVRNDLEAGGPPEASAESIEVRARTGMGDIVIERAPAR